MNHNYKNHHRRNSILSLLLVAVCIFFAFSGTSGSFFRASTPSAANGLLDLRSLDLDAGLTVNLKGEWEFYWKQLLYPGDFTNPSEKMQPLTVEIPGTWNDLIIDNKKIGEKGYATYRLKVLVNPPQKPLALKVKNIMSNYRLFVNGRMIGANGRIDKDEASAGDLRHPITISSGISGDELDIVLQVSNYQHARGGIFENIVIGSEEILRERFIKSVAFELFLIGSISIIGVYYTGIFFFRKEDYAPLYFSILCLLFTVRTATMGVRFAGIMISDLSATVSLKAEYLSVFLALPVFFSFLFHLFPGSFSKPLLKLVSAVSILLGVLVLVSDEWVYIKTLIIFKLIALVTLLYIGYSLLKAIRKNRPGARLILCGFLILSATAINDILFESKIIQTTYYLPLGLLGYILFQALYLSHRSSRNLKRIENLSQELSSTNETLEQRVKQRTEEINQKNVQLRAEIEEHESTAQELKAAKTLAEEANHAKSEFLANMSHELRTPMHGILGFAKFGEEKIDTAGRDSLLDFFCEIRSCGQRLLLLLNDLLDLSKLESGKIIYEFEEKHLSDIVKTVLREFSILSEEKNIAVDFKTPDFSTKAVMDEGKMIQVVRNLVSNAIKFSNLNSRIDIQISNSGQNLSLSVMDRGVGIPENELQDVFDKFVQSSKTKTAAGGTGLGLPISREIITDHKGEIWAENNKEGGATVTFSIPRERKQKRKLGEILVEQKLISVEDLEKGLKEQQT